ncbi:MAG: hypothetical protein IJ837_02370 [Clostridia bacterium]|nr:hypothetical protein [Clostridia bacterium]
MEEELQAKQPKKVDYKSVMQTRMNVKHLGKVLANLAFFVMAYCLIVSFGSFITTLIAFFIAFVIIVFMLVITIGSLGLIYANPNVAKGWSYATAVMDGNSSIVNFFITLFQSIPYVSACGILIAVGAILCLKFSKSGKHTTRYAFLGIAIAVFVVDFILAVGGAIK